MSLINYERNLQSQFGEDGVIEEIFNRIGSGNKICVEFGAWDGIHFSNSWNLWKNNHWKALLIEGDNNKFIDLKRNTEQSKNVIPYLAFVNTRGENALESILKRNQFPFKIDMLSIDIDGDDYYIFQSLQEFRPRLIIIEYNPTIPPNFEIIQREGEHLGCSALALLNLAREKEYKLVHMTNTNMFFVASEEFHKMNMPEVDLNIIFPTQHLTYVINSYDGRALLNQFPVYMETIPKEKDKKWYLDLFFKASKNFRKDNPIETVSSLNLIQVTIKQS